MTLDPDTIRRYGIRAVVKETIIEEFKDGKVVSRIMERQRTEYPRCAVCGDLLGIDSSFDRCSKCKGVPRP